MISSVYAMAEIYVGLKVLRQKQAKLQLLVCKPLNVAPVTGPIRYMSVSVSTTRVFRLPQFTSLHHSLSSSTLNRRARVSVAHLNFSGAGYESLSPAAKPPEPATTKSYLWYCIRQPARLSDNELQLSTHMPH